MNAVTEPQPYASLVALGVKTMLTRSSRPPERAIGERLIIHAGLKAPSVDDCLRLMPFVEPQHAAPIISWAKPEHGGLPRGAVVASAVLTDVVPTDFVNSYLEFARLGGIETTDPDVLAVTYGDELGEYGGPNYSGQTWDLAANRTFGDFADGRFFWLLDDVKATTERCPWCWGNGRVEMLEHCPVCNGASTVDPIPAKGRPDLWDWTP